MLEETCQADAVVGEMGFFADDYDVVFSSLYIVFEKFFSVKNKSVPCSVSQRLVDQLHECDAHHAQPYYDDLLPLDLAICL